MHSYIFITKNCRVICRAAEWCLQLSSDRLLLQSIITGCWCDAKTQTPQSQDVKPMVTACFSLIQHNAAPSFHSLLAASEQVNPHLPILFWHLQRAQSDSGSSIPMPAPPALCLSSVQKQEHKKSITEGYQRAEIIIICIISEFGWQPSPDPSLPGNNKYLC